MTGNKNLKIAVVGVGGMGSRWAKVASTSGNSQLAVLVDNDLQRVEQAKKKFNLSAPATNDLGAVLADKEIDAVVIATPHVFLAEIASKALQNNKHVLTEKPGAISAKQMESVLDLARQKGLRYMVAFNHRFHSALWKAKELVDQGEIGQILFIRGRYGHGGRPGYEKEWRAKPELSGGGELLDQGIHLIDLASWFLGDFSTVKGVLATNFWQIKPLEDNAFVILQNQNKQTAMFHASWTQWKKMFSFEIMGEKGYMIIEGLSGKYGPEILTVGKRDNEFNVNEEVLSFANPKRIDPDDSLYNLWQEFTNSILENREPAPSAKDAYEALKIIDKIYQQAGSK